MGKKGGWERRKLSDPRMKPGIVGAFCRAYSIEAAIEAFLSDVYQKCGGWGKVPRYTYLGGSTYGGASVYNKGQHLYSWHQSDPAGGAYRCCNAFDLVRIHKFGKLDEGSYGTGYTHLPSYIAMCAWAEGLDEVQEMMKISR